MDPDTAAVMLLFGFFGLMVLCLGIWGLSAWVAQQIEARQKRPQLEAQAAAKRADAERKLEEARIRRLELELGISTSDREIGR